jgi:hypothetical protein
VMNLQHMACVPCIRLGCKPFDTNRSGKKCRPAELLHSVASACWFPCMELESPQVHAASLVVRCVPELAHACIKT